MTTPDERIAWRKSSYSGGGGDSGGDCVEVGLLHDGRPAVRDSTDPDGPVLAFSAPAFRRFVHRHRAGAPTA